MPIPSRSGSALKFAFTDKTAKKWDVFFLQRVKTPNGLGTVIGERAKVI